MNIHRVHYGRRLYRTEYLQSDEWKEIRGRILKASNNTCWMCKKGATDVHHMDYRILGIPHLGTRDFLVALCRRCHDMVEDAIVLGVIPMPHHRGHLELVTPEAIKDARKKEGEEKLWDSKLTRIVNSASRNKQLLVCGVMKISHPGDFRKWEGVKIRKDYRRKIMEICNVQTKMGSKKWKNWNSVHRETKTLHCVLRSRTLKN